MSVTREEVITKLTKLTGRRNRKKIADIDDNAELFGSRLIDSFAVIDLVAWLGKKIGKRFTADDVTLEDLESVGKIMAFAKKHSS